MGHFLADDVIKMEAGSGAGYVRLENGGLDTGEYNYRYNHDSFLPLVLALPSIHFLYEILGYSKSDERCM